MSKQIFICGCEKDGKIEKESVEKLMQTLEEKNIGFTYIEDMCGTILKNPKDLESLYTAKEAVVFGCQARAMQNLLDNSGGRKEDLTSEYHHIDDEGKDELISSLESGTGEPLQIKYSDDWKPWYPVIDYERCNGCRKCLNFCLFSVYSVEDDGTVVVSSSANCKDMCPACARVCPQNAIIFPKHAESPIDGGEGDGLQMEKTDILEQIQNDDVYSVLSARRKNFQVSLLKKDQLQMAEEERRACCSGSEKKEEKKEEKCDCDCNCKDQPEASCDCDCDCKDGDSGSCCC
ncbi:ATP-binding protein [Marinifilum sp.]|uniref:ATP-binding protein n=1 Tax=Marinifilum sp. TaxID=2033137 RepID=UPI003BA90211